jgi:putative nucleotidyltransferase-like protein
MNTRFAAWEIVCGALSPDVSPELQDRLSSSKSLWPVIIGWADAHLVTPAVYVGLRKKALLEHLPEEAHQYLQAVYQMNHSRNGALLNQLDEAIRLMNSRGIVPVLLKGAAYLKTGVYEDTAARILSDLDLLVEEARVSEAVDALRSVGYEERDVDWNPQHKHWAPLVRPGVFGGIEIHRRLFDGKSNEILPVDAVWNDLVVERQSDLSYSCLSPTKTVLLSFLHSEVVDRLGPQFIVGLRPIQDLLALHGKYREKIDWTAIHGLLGRHGAAKSFRDYLYAARRLAGLTVLSELRFGLREQAHFTVCQAGVRWKTVELLRPHIDEFSDVGIRAIYGTNKNGIILDYYRLVRAVRKVARGGRMIVSSRNGFR